MKIEDSKILSILHLKPGDIYKLPTGVSVFNGSGEPIGVLIYSEVDPLSCVSYDNDPEEEPSTNDDLDDDEPEFDADAHRKFMDGL